MALSLRKKHQESGFLDTFSSKGKDLIFVLEEEGFLPILGSLWHLFCILSFFLMDKKKFFLFFSFCSTSIKAHYCDAFKKRQPSWQGEHIVVRKVFSFSHVLQKGERSRTKNFFLVFVRDKSVLCAFLIKECIFLIFLRFGFEKRVSYLFKGLDLRKQLRFLLFSS